MATTLISSIENPVFASDLEVIQMTSDESPIPVMILDAGNRIIFNTVLYPLSNGSVSLFDVADILDKSLGDYPCGSFSIWVKDRRVCYLNVIRSAVKLSLPAREWTASRFLTSMTDERDTAEGRFETLSCYNPQELPCTAECIYLTEDNTLVYKVVPVAMTEKIGYVAEYDVSPHRFVRSGYELVQYTIKAGDMTQRYRVLRSPAPDSVAFVFRNNFGCWETLYCAGELATDPQYDRHAYMVSGRFEAYDTGETDSATASTGVMRFGAEYIARDMARSRYVYLLNADGTRGERVVITDCSVKATNAYDFLPQFSFTYRLSHKGAADLDKFRIFDYTFDVTYE